MKYTNIWTLKVQNVGVDKGRSDVNFIKDIFFWNRSKVERGSALIVGKYPKLDKKNKVKTGYNRRKMAFME